MEIIHGLCAESFKHLQESFRFAPKCTNIKPCEEGSICYPNSDVSYLIDQQFKALSKSPSKSPSSIPTMSPVTFPPTSTPTHRPLTPHPTHSPNTYSPTESNKDPVAKQKVPQKPAQKDMPVFAEHNSSKKNFYCASSIKELELSCEGAFECDIPSRVCPQGQACFEYGECSENISHLCPPGFVGLHSPKGDCKKYYDCTDGLLIATHMCQVGQLFDNESQRCHGQEFVNNKCQPVSIQEDYEKNKSNAGKTDIVKSNTTLVVENEQYLDVTSKETLPDNYRPDLCPLGFNGLRSPEGDCKHYYDCKDELLQQSHVCGVGLMFDNVQGSCISQKLVNNKCRVSILETSTDQNQASAASEEPSHGSTNEAAQTNINQSQIAESSKGDSDNTLSEVVSKDEQKTLVPSDNYSLDLCPPGFDGFHTKEKCTQYFECSNGYVGFVHTCTEKFKFDKVSSRCISEDLVTQFCYGPALNAEQKQNPTIDTGGEQADVSVNPPLSPSPATSIARPVPSRNEGGVNGEQTSLMSDTLTPSAPNIDSDHPRFTNWLREDMNGEIAPAKMYPYLWMLSTVLPISWIS